MVPLDLREWRRGRLGCVLPGCGCGCVPPPPSPSSWTDELDEEADDIMV